MYRKLFNPTELLDSFGIHFTAEDLTKLLVNGGGINSIFEKIRSDDAFVRKYRLEAARETGAAVAAVPVKNTIKFADDMGLITETPQRDRLWTAQTPQIFSFDVINKAYQKLTTEVTDDAAAAVEQLGYKVKLYMGAYNNIKVTTPQDLALAEIIAQNISTLPPVLKSRI